MYIYISPKKFKSKQIKKYEEAERRAKAKLTA